MTRETLADWAAARSDKWRRQLAGLEAMLAPIDTPLIRASELNVPVRVADVGCGGGATTLEVLRCSPAGSIAHGYDLSPALIEVARRRHTRKGGSVAFEIADMGQAPPPDRPYDRLISRFGVMFFADAPSAFANLRRWLVPGGRIAFAVWGPVTDNVWIQVTREVVADLVDLPAIDPMTPGPFRYGDAALLLSLLEQAGFSDLAVKDWRQALPIGGTLSAAGAAQFALASFSSFAELLNDAGGKALDTAGRALTSRFEAYERDGAVRMNARVHIITGVAR